MNPSEFNLQAQVACARRELGWRQYVYPRRVAAGKMTPADANREIACMEAVLVTLTKLLLEEQKTNNPTLFDLIKS
jgi:hypothetical protein